jgi:hypothetical protein
MTPILTKSGIFVASLIVALIQTIILVLSEELKHQFTLKEALW